MEKMLGGVPFGLLVCGELKLSADIVDEYVGASIKGSRPYCIEGEFVPFDNLGQEYGKIFPPAVHN
jgi:hypothetical protein